MKRTLFIWGIYFLSFASTTFATGIAIQTLFPNTSNDAALEYIEVLNSGCNSINLSGFSLKDASGKVFLFPQEVLDPKITRRFLRGETGIILNNSDEVVELFDSSGLLVDRVQYSSTTKDKKIVFDVAHDICETPLEVESPSFSGATELELLPQDVVNENILSHETYGFTGYVDLIFTGTLQGEQLENDFILDGLVSHQTDLNILQNVSSPAQLSVLCRVLPQSKNPVPEIVSGSAQLADDVSTASGNNQPVGNEDTHPPESPPIETNGSESQQAETGALENPENQNGSGSESQTQITASETSLSQSASGSIQTQASTILNPLLPQKLYLWDLDKNGKLDTIEVVYSGMLSGSLDKTKIFLYSASGGIFSEKIEGCEKIQSVKAEENRLILTLQESSSSLPHLNISSNTSSHLRLKTYSGFGLIGKNGEVVTGLTYTQSFDGYNVSQIWNYVEYPDSGKPPPIAQVVSNVISPSTPVINTREESQSGSQSVGVLNTYSQTGVAPTLFAEQGSGINSEVLSLTDLIQSGLTGEGKCLFENCKINLFYQGGDKYTVCSWDFLLSSGEVKTYSSCNPPIVTLGERGGKIYFHSFNSQKFTSLKKDFQIYPLIDSVSHLAIGGESIQKIAFSPELKKSLVPSASGKQTKEPSITSTIPRATKISTASKATSLIPKKITVKTPSKTPAKVTAKTPVKKVAAKEKISTTKKPESTKVITAKKDVPKKSTVMMAQENTSTITGVLGVACTILGFVFAAYKRKTGSDITPTV